MDLLEQLIDQLGVTRQQAEGGAGLLLRHVESELSADQFLLVADAIPAISDWMAKAPREMGVAVGPLQVWWQGWLSGWGGLVPLRASFEQMGLDLARVEKLKGVLFGYFSEQAGQEVGESLTNAWR